MFMRIYLPVLFEKWGMNLKAVRPVNTKPPQGEIIGRFRAFDAEVAMAFAQRKPSLGDSSDKPVRSLFHFDRARESARQVHHQNFLGIFICRAAHLFTQSVSEVFNFLCNQ